MGSGRGKTKRARATAIPGAAKGGGVGVDITKWFDFLNKNKLQEVLAMDYYGIDPRAADSDTRFAGEMLRDMINVGAITLPADVDASDLRMETEDCSDNYGSFQRLFVATNCENTENSKGEVTDLPFHEAPDDQSFSSIGFTNIAYSLSDAVMEIFGGEDDHSPFGIVLTQDPQPRM